MAESGHAKAGTIDEPLVVESLDGTFHPITPGEFLAGASSHDGPVHQQDREARARQGLSGIGHHFSFQKKVAVRPALGIPASTEHHHDRIPAAWDVADWLDEYSMTQVTATTASVAPAFGWYSSAKVSLFSFTVARVTSRAARWKSAADGSHHRSA